MNLENYIFEILLNKNAKKKFLFNKLELNNSIIDAIFINAWNNVDYKKLSTLNDSVKYLFDESNKYLEILQKLNIWYSTFKEFEVFSNEDIKNIDKEKSKLNKAQINENEKINEKSSFKIFDDNKILDCISIKKTNEMIEFEKKENYVLNEIFNSIYFQLDELFSILCFMLFKNTDYNYSLQDKINQLTNISWLNIENNKILIMEIISIKNYFKTWESISFSMTKEKLNEFLILINKIYLNIIDMFYLPVFINIIDQIKDIYYNLFY